MKAIYRCRTTDGIKDFETDVGNSVLVIKGLASDALGVQVLEILEERPVGKPSSIEEAEYAIPLKARFKKKAT